MGIVYCSLSTQHNKHQYRKLITGSNVTGQSNSATPLQVQHKATATYSHSNAKYWWSHLHELLVDAACTLGGLKCSHAPKFAVQSSIVNTKNCNPCYKQLTTASSECHTRDKTSHSLLQAKNIKDLFAVVYRQYSCWRTAAQLKSTTQSRMHDTSASRQQMLA